MSPVLATRRRAEDFALLVDGQRSTHDPTLTPLVATARRLRNPAPIEPSEDFRQDLRARLLEAAAELPAQAPARRPFRTDPALRLPSQHRTRLLAVATALTLVAGVIGAITFSRQALPGDALYVIKRGLEQTQVAVSTSTEARGRQYLAAGASRLHEVTELVRSAPIRSVDDHRVPLVRSTLEDFRKQSKEGGELLIAAYEADQHRAAIVELREFTTRSETQLKRLAPALPKPLRSTASQAAGIVSDLDARAGGLCPTCIPDLGSSRVVEPDPGRRGPLPTPGPTSESATPGPQQSTGVPEPRPTQPSITPSPRPTVPSPGPSQTQDPNPLPTIRVPRLPLPTSLPLPLPPLGEAAATPQWPTGLRLSLDLDGLFGNGDQRIDPSRTAHPTALGTFAPDPRSPHPSPSGAPGQPAPTTTTGPVPTTGPTGPAPDPTEPSIVLRVPLPPILGGLL